MDKGKREMAVVMAQEIISLNNASKMFRFSTSYRGIRTKSLESIEPKFDALCNYLLDNFDLSTCNREDEKYFWKYIAKRSNDTSILDDPTERDKMSEGLFALTLIKELIKDNEFKFNTNSSAGWDRFTKVYFDTFVVSKKQEY